MIPTPSVEDIISLENAVIVDCTKQDAHPNKTYKLEKDSYLVGQVQGNECTVSIYETDPYIAKYNTDVDGTHQLNNQKQDYEVQLSYENGKWTVANPAHIYVECETGGKIDPPTDGPSKEQILWLLSEKAVCVECTTTTNHEDEYYPYDGDFTYSIVGTKCRVTLTELDAQAQAYIDQYNSAYRGHEKSKYK